MSHPTDYLPHPQPESGQGLHSQESGDDGFSSNMEHKFSDNYGERALPVADKESFVKPEEERDIFRHTELAGKIWSYPAVFGYAAFPKAEPHSVSDKGGFVKTSTATVQENNPQKETDEVLTKTITEEQPDVEVVEEDSCIVITKMDVRGKPIKPKVQRLVPRERRNKPSKKRAAVFGCFVLCWMAVKVPGVHGAETAAGRGFKYFNCADKERCPTLMTIYDSHDTPVYQRASNHPIPGCCGISPPTPGNCNVCLDLNVTIICSNDTEPVEVEDSEGKGLPIVATSPVSCVQHHTQGHYGLFLSGAIILILSAALLIYSQCCSKNRNGNNNSEEHFMTENNITAV